MKVLTDEEVSTLQQFKNIIVWGYPLNTHTQSYIHAGFYKAFKVVHTSVHWFHDTLAIFKKVYESINLQRIY